MIYFDSPAIYQIDYYHFTRIDISIYEKNFENRRKSFTKSRLFE